ncbi:MAG: holo-ACP synthase [Lentimicrobiaceae bacterium]|jgi:holo-[acyl-carrier protein] synthase|nr:holo-ACP synthase [Lentimicrobiaceae bacterium]
MIFGIGTDIIEVARMESHLKKSDAFKNKIFTINEQNYCEGKAIMYQHYAARFAAKEAFFKALGTGYRDGMAFTEIEVINDSLGKPVITINGKVEEFTKNNKITNIHLSISHIKELVNAFVVLEKE